MKKLKEAYNGIRTDVLVKHWKNNTEQDVFMSKKKINGDPFYIALFNFMGETAVTDWIKLNEHTDSVWREFRTYELYGGNDTLRLKSDFSYIIEESFSLKQIIKKYGW